MIDTHTHLYSEEFDKDRTETIERAIQSGIQHFFLPAIDSNSHEKMLNLEKQYPQTIHSMMGLHPCHVKPECWEEELRIVKKYLNERKFIAVGEIGIDSHWDKSTLHIQRKAFSIQIDWALEKNLPIVIHCRESFNEIFEILKTKKKSNLRGVFHCFSGTIEEALSVIHLGFSLGIGGVVTFKNGKIDQILDKIPLEKIVLETDSPYLTPIPFRGKRNESAYLHLIAEKIAQIYQKDIAYIKDKTTQNTLELFKLS